MCVVFFDICDASAIDCFCFIVFSILDGLLPFAYCSSIDCFEVSTVIIVIEAGNIPLIPHSISSSMSLKIYPLWKLYFRKPQTGNPVKNYRCIMISNLSISARAVAIHPSSCSLCSKSPLTHLMATRKRRISGVLDAPLSWQQLV